MNKIPIYRIALIVCVLAGLQACTSGPDPTPEVYRDGERYLNDGVAAFAEGDYASAVARLEKALLLYQGIDDVAGQLRARIDLAQTALSARNAEEAARHLAALDRLSLRSENHGFDRRIILLRAALAFIEGHAVRSASLLAPLLPNFARDPANASIDGIALTALANRTRIAMDQDPAAAILWVSRLDAALTRAGGGTLSLSARLHRFQAQLAMRQQDYSGARQHYRMAHGQYRVIRSKPGLAQTLREWGELERVLGNSIAALDRFATAIAIRSSMRDQRGVLAILQRLRILAAQPGAPLAKDPIEQWIRTLKAREFTDWRTFQRQIELIVGN